MMTVCQSLFLRLVSLAFGLAVMAMGIVLCIRADLGITPHILSALRAEPRPAAHSPV